MGEWARGEGMERYNEHGGKKGKGKVGQVIPWGVGP